MLRPPTLGGVGVAAEAGGGGVRGEVLGARGLRPPTLGGIGVAAEAVGVRGEVLGVRGLVGPPSAAGALAVPSSQACWQVGVAGAAGTPAPLTPDGPAAGDPVQDMAAGDSHVATESEKSIEESESVISSSRETTEETGMEFSGEIKLGMLMLSLRHLSGVPARGFPIVYCTGVQIDIFESIWSRIGSPKMQARTSSSDIGSQVEADAPERSAGTGCGCEFPRRDGTNLNSTGAGPKRG